MTYYDSYNTLSLYTNLEYFIVRGFDMKKTYFIGDSFRDLAAAKDFGCTGMLVLSGRQTLQDKDSWEYTPQYVFDTLLDAARFICLNHE